MTGVAVLEANWCLAVEGFAIFVLKMSQYDILYVLIYIYTNVVSTVTGKNWVRLFYIEEHFIGVSHVEAG